MLLYHGASGCYFLDYEFEKAEQLTSDFAKHIKGCLETKYKDLTPVDLVGDSGGGGKKTLQDMNHQEKLFITSASKHDKLSAIKLLRDKIREGKFFVRRDSIFYREVDLIAWDEHKTKIDDRLYHSDILDAILYALRMLTWRT